MKFIFKTRDILTQSSAQGGLLSICLTVLLLTSSLASAESTSLAQSYRSSTASLLKAIKNSGYQSLGHVDTTGPVTIDQLEDSLAATRIIEDPSFQKPAGSTRLSAFYSPSEGTVFIDPKASHPLQIRDVLGLHELFGLRGIPDQNYEFSILLKLFTERSRITTDENDPMLKSLKLEIDRYLTLRWKDQNTNHFKSKNPANDYLINGSGTRVGGGGDGDGLYLKALIVEMIFEKVIPRLPSHLQKNLGSHRSLVTIATNLNIEVDPTVNEIIFETRAKDGLLKSIRVPKNMHPQTAALSILRYLNKQNIIPIPLNLEDVRE